jgi:ATP-dependent Zn protease
MASRKLVDTAYHEAGHAVAAYAMRKRVESVTVIPEDEYLGCVRYHGFPEWFRPDIDSGGTAGEMHTRRYNRVGASSDMQLAFQMASYMVGGVEDLEDYIDRAQERATAILEENWPAVEALAEALLLHGELSGRAARKIMREAMKSAKSVELGSWAATGEGAGPEAG